jgi:hypothetical protein
MYVGGTCSCWCSMLSESDFLQQCQPKPPPRDYLECWLLVFVYIGADIVDPTVEPYSDACNGCMPYGIHQIAVHCDIPCCANTRLLVLSDQRTSGLVLRMLM